MSKSTGDVDAIVVGSGAGGAPLALALARAGARVVVFEKGRHLRAEEFLHDEVAKRRHFLVPDRADEPHTIRYGTAREAALTSEGWTANVVGGGTVHYSGFFHRMQPVDMRLRSTLGPVEGATIADWPISYADLEPYYRRVEEEIGVSGVSNAHPFEEPRSAPYPLPPLDEHPVAGRLDAAASKLGMHAFPTPRAVLSRAYRGRPACSYCSMCADYGCPTGAKSSTLATLIPAAVATGNCEIRAQCMVTEVAVRADGRVAGVVYRDSEGLTRSLDARVVILACSAVETARLLLLSRSTRFPDGLANGAGQVGKNLVFSSTSIGGAWWETSLGGDETRHLSAQRSLQDFYFMKSPVDGVAKAGTILFLIGFVQPITIAESIVDRKHGKDDRGMLWGTALKKSLREELKRSHLHFETFGEFYPNPGTFVDLDPSVRDRWGAPVARMTIAPHAEAQKGSALLAKKAIEVLKTLSPDDTYVTSTHGETKFLQGGTCRSGADPATSVLDAHCRAHEVPNLYVTDGSFLPTSGGVPLSLTLMANSFRVSEHVIRQLRQGAL